MFQARISSRLCAVARQVAIFCALLALTASLAVAQLAPAKVASARSIVSRFMAEQSVPGLAVAVVVDGKLAWAEGFGFADLENFVPASPDTLFRLASVSKPITAVGALQLWQQGKLDLDAPIQHYCPAFPVKEAPITTRQLLGHLAGIRHYHDGDHDPEVFNITHYEHPIADGMKLFANDPLLSRPGAEFHYTTHGFTVAGCAIEGASGQDYVSYIREHVLRPAGMATAQVDDRFAVIQHRTRFYEKNGAGAVVNTDPLDSGYKIPGGGWIASAEDMAAFEIALMSDALLERRARDLMWKGQKPQRSAEEIAAHDDYAMGWDVTEESGVRIVGHTGGQLGTSTIIKMAPDQRAGVVVLANLEGVPVARVAGPILRMVLGLPEAAK